MQDHKHASALLTLATSNIKALQAMVQDKEAFSDAFFGFQAQQAVPGCFAVQFRYEVWDDEAIDRQGVNQQVELCLQHVSKMLDAL